MALQAFPIREHQIARTRAKAAARKQLARIEEATRSGKVRIARRLQNEYFTMSEAKLWAAVRALRRVGNRRTLMENHIASQINVYQPCCEDVGFREERNGSKVRTVVEFGALNTAQQLMALDVLRASARVPEWQYSAEGRSQGRLIENVKSTIEEGFTHFICADIANCFPSFDGERIIDHKILPLPRQVVRHTIMAENLVVSTGSSCSGYGPILSRSYNRRLQPRRLAGLPQGSVSSPFVAALVLSDLPSKLPAGVRLFGYMDDLLILARTAEEVHEAQSLLRDALLGHRAGRLLLKEPTIIGEVLRTPLNFVSYKVVFSERELRVDISDKSYLKFRHAIQTAIFNDCKNRDQALTQTHKALDARLRNFPLWGERDAFRDEVLSNARYSIQTELLLDSAYVEGSDGRQRALQRMRRRPRRRRVGQPQEHN